MLRGLELVAATGVKPLRAVEGDARLIAAARLRPVRLLDNLAVAAAR